jgi:steroid 5-alpha reductase family enzyme
MVILFVFISIPMMEKRSIENKPNFKEHMKTTPALIPSIKKMFSS